MGHARPAEVTGDHAAFDAAIRRRLSPGAMVLDAGAGSGVRHRHSYGTSARVIGVDMDAGIRANESVHHAVIADLARLPFRTGSFDLVFARYVLEHLGRPLTVFREVRRVLRPGGHFVVQTPNRFHYVALAATLTPHRFHVWFRARRRLHLGRSAGDTEATTFPTRYRANDRRTIRALASGSRFRVASLALFEPQPTYLFFHPLAFRAGVAYQRVVTSSERLATLRCVIVGDLEAR